MKKGKGEGKIPAADIREWAQPTMMAPPALMSTSILISDPEATPKVQTKPPNLSDFGFVLGSIEGSADSQLSGGNLPLGGSPHLGHITSEIETACSPGMSDNCDSGSESAWSASSAWSDEEAGEYAAPRDCYSISPGEWTQGY